MVFNFVFNLYFSKKETLLLRCNINSCIRLILECYSGVDSVIPPLSRGFYLMCLQPFYCFNVGYYLRKTKKIFSIFLYRSYTCRMYRGVRLFCDSHVNYSLFNFIFLVDKDILFYFLTLTKQ